MYDSDYDTKCKVLLQKIDELEKYGHDIFEQSIHKHYSDLNRMIGLDVMVLAQNLRSEVGKFIAGTTHDKKAANKKINQLIKAGQLTMRKDRKSCNIIAHIVLALTGIGLVIMVIHRAYPGSFFLNKTKGQKILEEIKEVHQAAQHVL